MTNQDRIDRVIAILEGDHRLVARLDMAEAMSEMIDKAAFSMLGGPTEPRPLSNRLDNPAAWLKAERERADIDRVIRALSPPPPPPPPSDDNVRFSYGFCRYDVAKFSDFGVICT